MSLRAGALLLLTLSVALGLVKLVDPRADLLVDAALVASVVGFVVCTIGHLGRRLAELVLEDRPTSDERRST